MIQNYLSIQERLGQTLLWATLLTLLAALLGLFGLAQQWLSDFAYRTPVSALPFVLAIVGALVPAVITVGSRAPRANPADSLRSE